MDRASEFLSEISGHPRITPALFCHSPYLCSQETFASAKRMCDSRGIRLYCHVAETAWEVTEMGARYGKTPVEFLKAAGVLDDSFTGVHAVHLTEKDMDMVAEAGASLVHCPEANLKQSSGAARPAQWLSKGIPTALGTDGPASNNNLDMIEEMRTATLVSKLFEGERDALNAADAVRAATYGSARALGLENRIAVIEAGREADFITIDFSGPHMTPMYDPLSHLVYCARASDVRDVYVAGACIVSEGRPVHPVLGALGEKIDEFKERIALRIGGSITKNRRRTLG
jgi:5-methylthioadenosine/S-adenosylhomocysteine deaminase